LSQLLSEARLHRIGDGPRGIEAQRQAMLDAAFRISLGGDLRLSGALELDPSRIGDLAGRIGQQARWPKGRRPHGVLAFIAERIEGNALVCASGLRLAVEGTISVFGPGQGRVRHGPFVVAMLVASPDGQAPLAPIEAYAPGATHVGRFFQLVV